ncbi:hypothetical protein L7F22_002056 [Adiantum nelumboides]|nr:hypothetical protein [Adiantum nelumboides]
MTSITHAPNLRYIAMSPTIPTHAHGLHQKNQTNDNERSETNQNRKSQGHTKREKKNRSRSKGQEEAEAAQAAQAQETKVVDLSGTIEYLKKLEREKHIAEQRVAQLAREKIKEALSRKVEEPVLERAQGNPKRPRQEEEEEIEHIQADPIPPSPINIPLAPPSSPITPFPPASTPQKTPSPSPLDIPISPIVPTSPTQQPFFANPLEIPTSPQKETAQPMDKAEEEVQKDSEPLKPADIDISTPMIQLDEPTKEEAIQEVKSFDYTKLIHAVPMPTGGGKINRAPEGQSQQGSRRDYEPQDNSGAGHQGKRLKRQRKRESLKRFNRLAESTDKERSSEP